MLPLSSEKKAMQVAVKNCNTRAWLGIVRWALAELEPIKMFEELDRGILFGLLTGVSRIWTLACLSSVGIRLGLRDS